MEREKHQFSDMDGGLGTSRRLAALHATGEEGETVKDISGTYDATNSNPHGRFVADDTGVRSRINLRSKARIGTWNVRTLYQTGKLVNVIQEMNRCGISALGIAETHWTGKGHFTTATGELVIFSGSQDHRAGVGVTLSKSVSNSMIAYRAISDRVLYVRIRAAPFNISLIEVYAPTTEATDEKVEEFYDQTRTALEISQSQDVVFVAGDFNAKVGTDRLDPDVCGRYGLETLNERGERLINFCRDHDLFITNTAFKHHERRRYTWQSPGGGYRNQIDFILVKNRWKTCVENSRAYPGPDCGSDHNLVGAVVRLKIKKNEFKSRRVRLNLDALSTPMVKEMYNVQVNNRFAVLKLLDEDRQPDELFKEFKEAVLTTAGEVLGKAPKKTRKPWISDNTLRLMDQRRALKALRNSSEEGEERYREAHRAIQREARREKARWLEEQCASVEEGLKRNNSRKAYQFIKTLRKTFQPKLRNIKNAEHRVLTDLKDILRRWRDYAKDLYHDENNLTNEDRDQSPTLPILESEVEKAIRKLPKNKAAGIDDLPAELLKTDNQQMTKIVCQLCNKILESGEWATDWLRTIFILIPKTVGIIECAEHRIIALISHNSKVLLRILLSRTAKTAEEQIAEEQMGFRQKVGTRDQIFNIRMIMEKAREFNIPLYMAFIDFKKAFDSVRHTALCEIMKKMGVSEQIISPLRKLYQNQEAAIRVESELSEWFKIKKGVRQGSPISPICFNFFLEEVMRRTTDEMSWVGMRICGKHLNNLRFADDVVLIATSAERLQALIDEVDRVSKEFQLEISTSKTKIMATTNEPQQLLIRCRG